MVESDAQMVDEAEQEYNQMRNNNFISVDGLDGQAQIIDSLRAGDAGDVENDDVMSTKYLLIDSHTGEQFQSSNCEPLISQRINGVKDVFRPIKNDKELDAEIARIVGTLADDKTADWKQRVNDL